MNRACLNQRGSKKKRVNQSRGQELEKLPQAIVRKGGRLMTKLTTGNS